MTSSPLTYFTAKLTYQAVVADEAVDADADPQVKGVNAGVTITAFVQQPPPRDDDIHQDEIPASTLSPTAAMLVLSKIRARIDNGDLCLRADPDLVVHNFPNMAAFPSIGTAVSTNLYFAADTDKTYKFVGPPSPHYEEVPAFAPVRLVAHTAVLELPADAILCYRVDFDHVTFGGADQQLPSFAFKAPTTDVVLDLVTAQRVPL